MSSAYSVLTEHSLWWTEKQEEGVIFGRVFKAMERVLCLFSEAGDRRRREDINRAVSVLTYFGRIILIAVLKQVGGGEWASVVGRRQLRDFSETQSTEQCSGSGQRRWWRRDNVGSWVCFEGPVDEISVGDGL